MKWLLIANILFFLAACSGDENAHTDLSLDDVENLLEDEESPTCKHKFENPNVISWSGGNCNSSSDPHLLVQRISDIYMENDSLYFL